MQDQSIRPAALRCLAERAHISGAAVATLAATLLTAVGPAPAAGQDMVYRPINPTFGGNPFNSNHLLGTATAQNTYRDPAAATGSSPGDVFARQLQSRLLSALSGQLVDAIFGENPQQSGTISLGSQTIRFDRGLEDVTLVITDTNTGETTTIVVPTFLKVD